MADFKIYIPSRGRHKEELQYTLANLGPASLSRTTLVVRPDEHEKYIPIAEKFNVQLAQRPEVCQNLSQTLDWIIHDLADPEDTCIMCDDDLRWSVRINRDDMSDPKLRMADGYDVDDIMRELHDLVQDGYPMAGISARGGNNNQKEQVSYATRQMQVHAVKPAYFRENEIHPSEVLTKSDFHMTLSVLKTGLENAVINWATVDQAKGSNSEGGVSAYRDLAALQQGARRLKELHPGFVSIVTKTVKWHGIDEPFEDVRMAWKEALKWGRQNA